MHENHAYFVTLYIDRLNELASITIESKMYQICPYSMTYISLL